MKIISVIGARPQFIKAATISRSLKQRKANEIIVHTGQHFDDNMSNVFFNEMKIPQPDYYLKINNLSHGAMTGQMMEKIEMILVEEKPDMVLVYGDTNSTMAGALAAVKLHIPVAHVEAGLRSANNVMPEEINRIVTDRISTRLYCPTNNAVANLTKEGFNNFDCKILLTGDVMLDAVNFYKEQSNLYPTLERFNLAPGNFYLSTVHRAENTDNLQNLKSIIDALNKLNDISPVVLPIHPRTKKIIQENKLEVSFTLLEPVGYFDMMNLIKGSKLVLTDSGGLQKEAFFFNKFCITMREETEWIELVSGGYNITTGVNGDEILKGVRYFEGRNFESKDGLYGKGNAAELIVNDLLSDGG